MEPMESDSGGAYPATFEYQSPEHIANWRPLVHWLLIIPHAIVQNVLQTVAQVLSVVSWFIILFTGALPKGIADFQALFLRYSTRVGTYSVFLREEYPAFQYTVASEDPGDDPRVRVDVRPELETRNRLTVGFRFILIIPQAIVLAFLFIAVIFVVIIAFFAVLFTGRWPEGMRDFVLGVGRWWIRVEAYGLLLTDEYPPFSLD